MALQRVNVIVVPDDDVVAKAKHLRPDMVGVTRPNMMVMSNDSLRMYIRESTWDALQDSYSLTAKPRYPVITPYKPGPK